MILPYQGDVQQIEAPRYAGQSIEVVHQRFQPACGRTGCWSLAWFTGNANIATVENQCVKWQPSPVQKSPVAEYCANNTQPCRFVMIDYHARSFQHDH